MSCLRVQAARNLAKKSISSSKLTASNPVNVHDTSFVLYTYLSSVRIIEEFAQGLLTSEDGSQLTTTPLRRRLKSSLHFIFEVDLEVEVGHYITNSVFLTS